MGELFNTGGLLRQRRIYDHTIQCSISHTKSSTDELVVAVGVLLKSAGSAEGTLKDFNRSWLLN